MFTSLSEGSKMIKEFGCASRTSTVILILINFITMMICVMIFAVGVWTIVSPGTLSMVIQWTGITILKVLFPKEALTVELGVAEAVLSIFIFFIAFMGFYGAIAKSPFLLFMYATLVLLVLLLECSLFYYFTSNFIEKGIQDKDGQWTHVLRVVFQCCNFHVRGTSEVRSTSLPWSCCDVSLAANCTTDYSFEKDCNKTITDFIYRYQTSIYASLAAVHVVLSSCSLLRRSGRASYSHS